jgi:hypothetical protein
MEYIYSKVKFGLLLHIIFRKEDRKKGREDLVPAENFIQCSFLGMDKGKTFQPHKHIFKKQCTEVIAQESWLVLEGSVQCTFYDIDNSILCEPILEKGDVSFTLQGGHNYTILEEDTEVFEYKTGPYQGQALDKEFL